MESTASKTAASRPPNRLTLSPAAAIPLAVSFGFCAGCLDLGFIVFKKLCWNPEGSFRAASDFPWTVPASHAILMAIPGVAVAIANWLRPERVSLRAGTWFFATLAIGGALLRMPLYIACSLILALGLGRLISDAITTRGLRSWPARVFPAAMLGLLCVLAVFSSGRQALREYLAVAGLPPPPSAARNVVLIVWDTVRARSLSAYGYARNTTPNLARWARKGVKYNLALAPAPWTYPSHSSFFTGEWPLQLNTQWNSRLDTPDPTLAEFLASRGYQTAGFVANNNCCNYETGLARGFAHYEDYPLTPRSLLGRTVHGKWILENLVYLGRFYAMKWIGLQSRGAREINEEFLNWLTQRRPDRPFFAFLNYFDAHEPYIAPGDHQGRFGLRPVTLWDYRYFFDYIGANKDQMRARDLKMIRDGYDDCIAFLDEQLGRLLDELQRQELLENTEVIITSDHGESFGDHGFYGHSYTVHIEEISVPLVILSPVAPAGQVVYNAVSLRDLPATVMDLLGLSAGSPFPGHSLAAYWGSAPGQVQEITSPALSEQAYAATFQKPTLSGSDLPGAQMSLISMGHHYIRQVTGVEQLYSLSKDPSERVNLIGTPSGKQLAAVFRNHLLEVLTENPGSVEVEKAYLSDFRERLRQLVQGGTSTASR